MILIEKRLKRFSIVALGIPLKRPHGVWVRRDGALYVCDSYNDRILKLER